MAENQIEVELRVLLDDDSYLRLESFLKTAGKLVVKQDRFLIDYSTFLEGIGERKLDVRVRVTSGQVEIIVKKGTFGGSSREEAAVTIAGNNLQDALAIMALLGYRRGVAADRGITRYKVEDIEIAIQEVRYFGQPTKIHSRFFEAEIVSDKEHQQEAEEKLRSLLASLGFQPLLKEEWNAYVALLNTEVNGVFDYDTGIGFRPIPKEEWSSFFTSLTRKGE